MTTPPPVDTAPVWSTYIDTGDAAAWIGPNIDNDSNLQVIVDMACDWVQSFLDRPVAPTPMRRRFDSQGAAICLPYTPVASVTSVVEYSTGSGARILNESTIANQCDGWQLDYATGLLIRVNGVIAKPWMPGNRNIDIQWVAGYAKTPAKIVAATLELVKHWWDNTQQVGSIGVTSDPGYDPGSTAPGMWSGVPYRVESMLQPLTRIGLA